MKNQKDLFIGAFYTPDRNPKDFKELDKSLNKLTENGKKQKEVILAGDFNCPDIDWSSNNVGSSGKDHETQQSLVDITQEHLLTQIQLSPTRGPNVLDLVFTSNPTLAKTSVSIPGISDHDVVVSDFDAKPQIQHQKTRKCFKFGKANWERMKTDMNVAAKIIEERKQEGSDVDGLWTTFKNLLNSSMEANIPTFQLKQHNSLPWLTAPLRRMIKRKKRMFLRARAKNDWSAFRQYQKYCRRELRRAEWQFINGKIEEGLANNNTKPFWRYIKSRKQDSSGVAPLREEGQLFSDSQAKADILLKQFKSVFTTTKSSTLPNLEKMKDKIGPIDISISGVVKLLQKLNPNKASGPDNIPNRVLKNLATDIAPILTTIFQTSLDTGRLPQDWLKANISCAFKKGDRHSPSNYRPISLTSVCCKLLEHIVCRHIISHLEQYNLLTNLNHGFRTGFSTETQLLTTTNDLLQSFDQGKQVDMAILDFSKAFDTVPHDRLLHKLSSYGITGTLHQWLTCFLTERTMQVVVEGTTSSATTVDSGVPQGTVLGPLLFLCHINDLPKSVKSQVRLFADDCLIYREINDFKDHLTLQEDLKSLESWADRWGMRFNATKCYIMSIAQSPTSHHFYSLNNTILQQVKTNPYLGIRFSSDLKWNQHISSITKKANSILGFLRRNLRNSPTTCRKNAYLALVRPVCEYAAIIWDPYTQQEINSLERVQRNAARFIARDYRSKTPGFITSLLKKQELETLQERRAQLKLGFFYKVVEGLVPAISPGDFLSPQKPGRRIRSTRDSSTYLTQNPVENYIRNNDRCYHVPTTNTDQYRHSYFPQTIIEWNHLDNNTVNQRSVESFKAALARARR